MIGNFMYFKLHMIKYILFKECVLNETQIADMGFDNGK